VRLRRRQLICSSILICATYPNNFPMLDEIFQPSTLFVGNGPVPEGRNDLLSSLSSSSSTSLALAEEGKRGSLRVERC